MPADRELAESAVLSSVGAACARLIGALGGVLAARALGPAGRGQLSVLLALSGAGMTIAVAGLQFWAAREVARVGGVRGALSIIGTPLIPAREPRDLSPGSQAAQAKGGPGRGLLPPCPLCPVHHGIDASVIAL